MGYCNKCANDRERDLGDFAGRTSEAAWEQGHPAVVICDGCGATGVDPDGNPLATTHKKPPNRKARRRHLYKPAHRFPEKR